MEQCFLRVGTVATDSSEAVDGSMRLKKRSANGLIWDWRGWEGQVVSCVCRTKPQCCASCFGLVAELVIGVAELVIGAWWPYPCPSRTRE